MPKPIFKKGIVLVGLYWISQNNGFIFGQTTGMVSSLKKNDEGISLSEKQISIIASSLLMINFIGYSSAGVIADKIGRRWSFISFSILLTLYLVILYFAKNMSLFMLSKMIGGVGFGGIQSLVISITSEYTSPKTRAFFLSTINSVGPAIGAAFAHFLGVILHWRTVTLIGAVSSAIAIALPYFWTESPYWLASKGMFEECERSFKKLHGNKAEKELHRLIKLEQSKIDTANEENSEGALKKLRTVLKRKYFWEVIGLSTVIFVYMVAAAKVVFGSLATVMLEDITGTSDILYFTLLVDSFVVFGTILSCVLIRKMSMRTLLFSTGFSANAVLLILCGCLYFKNDELYFKWIIVMLLALYFIIIHVGPYPVVKSLLSEIFPVDIKSYCIFFSGVTIGLFFSLSVLLYPVIVASMGYHGMFLLNAAIMSSNLAYIWIKLPETKGKTLQEIEVYFKTKYFDVDEALNNVQIKSLI